MEFRYIPVDKLRDWWPSVRPGLDQIKGYSPENWIVEDVYTDCFNQKAMLWVGLENNHFKCFFILQPMGETMHLWAAWSLENNYQIVESDYDQFEQQETVVFQDAASFVVLIA